MEDITVRKNGLVYTADSKCVLGIDGTSSAFTGTVPNGAVKVGDEAFTCCNLTRISLPESVREVGSCLFSNSAKLEWVHLPSGLRKLAPYLFSGCAALTHVEMPLELSELPEGLFSGCASLTDIPFRFGVSTLPAAVFAGCSSLVSIAIPNTVNKICRGAIADCKNLQTIILPAALQEFEDGAVSGCPKLLRLRFAGENPRFYTSADGKILYRKNSGGEDTAVFKVEGAVYQAVPSVKEECDNPSIIDFAEDDDEVLTDNTLDSFQDEIEDDAEEQVAAPVQKPTAAEPAGNAAPEAQAANASDIDSRMAEIMRQDTPPSIPNFSISDIPEASEEELAASKLSATKKPAAKTAENAAPAAQAANASDIDSRMAEIMRQDTPPSIPNFSISDIPEASEEELAASKLTATKKPATKPAENAAPAAHAANASDIDSRMAEIMRQDTPPSIPNFSISDIPEASEEELAASKLTATKKPAAKTAENATPAAQAANASDIDSRMAEIMRQDTPPSIPNFSISDIPEASEEELAASKLTATKKPAEKPAENAAPAAQAANASDIDSRMAEIMRQDTPPSIPNFSISDIPEASEEELAASKLTATKKPAENAAPAAQAANASDIDSRMAEIMRQDTPPSIPNFSISDIPEASEEELAASKLASTKKPVVKPAENASPAAQAASTSDIDSRMEEIMRQDTPPSIPNFSISDIPEASEEELAASKLASTKKPTASPAAQAANTNDIDSRMEEIMRQDTPPSIPNFSISDIPEASEEELAASKLTATKKPAEKPAENAAPAAQAANTEETPDADAARRAASIVEEDLAAHAGLDMGPVVAEEPPESMKENPVSTPAAEPEDEFDEKAVMQNLFFESKKVMQKNMNSADPFARILYVFAEHLHEGELGQVFSARLENCCERLSKLHGFTSVYYFYGIDLKNEKFRKQFQKIMQNKDAVYAVAAGSLSDLESEQCVFAANAGIGIDKESMSAQLAKAADPNTPCLKLLLQDALQ